MNKKALTEADIRTKYILPALVQADWDAMTQIREEVYFTDGRVAEQRRIVAKVDELMTLCDDLEASLTRTQTESRRLLDSVLAEIDANRPKQ